MKQIKLLILCFIFSLLNLSIAYAEFKNTYLIGQVTWVQDNKDWRAKLVSQSNNQINVETININNEKYLTGSDDYIYLIKGKNETTYKYYMFNSEGKLITNSEKELELSDGTKQNFLIDGSGHITYKLNGKSKIFEQSITTTDITSNVDTVNNRIAGGGGGGGTSGFYGQELTLINKAMGSNPINNFEKAVQDVWLEWDNKGVKYSQGRGESYGDGPCPVNVTLGDGVIYKDARPDCSGFSIVCLLRYYIQYKKINSSKFNFTGQNSRMNTAIGYRTIGDTTMWYGRYNIENTISKKNTDKDATYGILVGKSNAGNNHAIIYFKKSVGGNNKITVVYHMSKSKDRYLGFKVVPGWDCIRHKSDNIFTNTISGGWTENWYNHKPNESLQ